jgi:MFS family permease
MLVPKSFYDGFANNFLVEAGVKLRVFGHLFEATAVQTLGQMPEVAVLILLPVLLHRVGVKWLMVFAMTLWMVRFICLANGFLHGKLIITLCIAGVILQSLCNDCMWVAAQIYINSKFAASEMSRGQSLYASVMTGLGLIVGSNVAGLVYNHYTASAYSHNWYHIWLFAAGVSACFAILFAWGFRDRISAREAIQ